MPSTPLTLEPVCTDRTLRSKPPPPLDDLIENAAGVIRSDSVRSGAASFSIATADLMWDRGIVKEACHGKAASPVAARRIARCEALERFQIAYAAPGTELVRGSYADLEEHAVNPADLFFWNAHAADARFDPLQPLSWTWAWSPAAREWRLVPAQDIWFNIPALMREPRLVFPSTNGCAAGATLTEAAVFAALEAIERDAFLTSWYLQRPARQIDPRSFKSEEMQLLLGRFRLALPNYRAVLFDLTSDVGIPTIGGLAIRRRGRKGPRVYASVATHIDAEKACQSALKDLTAFAADLTVEQLAEIRRRVNEPDGLDHPSGHMDLYALDESFHAFDYLQLGRRYVKVDDIGTRSLIPQHDELQLDAVVTAIDTRLRELGAALYLKELTHPAFAARGLRVVRAITPGLYPLWFGRKARRFAVTARLEALALRYCGRPFSTEQLQLATHPLG